MNHTNITDSICQPIILSSIELTNQNLNSSNLKSNLIGILCALASSCFIGASYVINKKSTENINTKQSDLSDLSETSPSDDNIMLKPRKSTLESIKINIQNRKNEENNSLGYKFLKSPLWWCYILFTAGGEGCNAVAYNYAPATLVTPLGALSMVTTCILSSQFLKERLNIVSKLGVVLAILGSIFIILNAPSNTKIDSTEKLLQCHFFQWPFLTYASINIALIIFFVAIQTKHFIYRILVISLLGSFVVISLKSITIIIAESGISGVIDNPTFYFFLTVLVIGLVVNAMQLTQALNLGDASTVIPIHYVCFTSSVIIGTNLLFQEYKNMVAIQMIQVCAGFVILCIAVFLIQEFKGVNMAIVKSSKNSGGVGGKDSIFEESD